MNRRLLAVLAALIVLAAAGSALATQNEREARFEVLGHVRPASGYSADVVLHRRHAYLSSHKGGASCTADGVRVYSLSDPRRPQRIATFGRIPGTWTEKTVVRRVATPSFTGDLAVTSVQSCRNGAFHGFALYDVTRPGRPRELARVSTEPRGSHEIWLQPIGRRIYVYTAIIASEILSSSNGMPGEPDFRIYDVTQPAQPVLRGGWGAWEALGLVPFHDPGNRLEGNFVHSVVGDGSRAYLSYWDLGTVVLDVRNPARPRYLGRTRRTDNAHSAWLGPRGLLIETHEANGGVATLHRRGAGNPVELGAFELPDAVIRRGQRVRGLSPVSGLDLTDSVHDAKVQGDTAFFSWYAQGVVAADVSNPREPRFLARFLPRPDEDRERLLCPGRHCTAVWGVDVEGDLVVASDMIGGLWILRFNRTS